MLKKKYDTEKGINPFVDDTSTVKYYYKNYYERNREKMLARQREKIKCECGLVVCRGGINNHRKTKRHKDHLDRKFQLLKRLAVATSVDAVVEHRSSGAVLVDWEQNVLLPMEEVVLLPEFVALPDFASLPEVSAVSLLEKVEETVNSVSVRDS